MTVNLIIKNIVTCKNDVEIENISEEILGDKSRHFISVPSAVNIKGKYLRNDIQYECSFFVKRALPIPTNIIDVNSLFLNEKYVYETVLPTLQSTSSISLPTAKYFGGSEEYILLENLKARGYESQDMTIGVGAEDTKHIIRELAWFHATSMKLKQDELETFKRLCKKTEDQLSRSRSTLLDSFADTSAASLKALEQSGLDFEASIVRENHLLDFDNLKIFLNLQSDIENFNVFSHGDTKSDNMMFLFDNVDGKRKATSFKIIDFQSLRKRSLFFDLILFLGTSVQYQILENNFDQFLKIYYENFTEACLKMGVYSIPNYELYYEEFKKTCKYCLSIIVWYLPIHSMIIDPNIDWSTITEDGKKAFWENSDKSLFVAKLKVYINVLSKYLRKSP